MTFPRGSTPPVSESAKKAWRTYRQPTYVAILSRALGISKAAVSKWTHVPESRVDAVSAVLGIPRDKLRPDLYLPMTGTSLNDYLRTATQGKT